MWAGIERVVATESSRVAEIDARGLPKTTKEAVLDRKTIRSNSQWKEGESLTLAKVVIGLRQE